MEGENLAKQKGDLYHHLELEPRLGKGKAKGKSKWSTSLLPFVMWTGINSVRRGKMGYIFRSLPQVKSPEVTFKAGAIFSCHLWQMCNIRNYRSTFIMVFRKYPIISRNLAMCEFCKIFPHKGLEKWLSNYKKLLLLQRAWVWFPALNNLQLQFQSNCF